MDSSFRLSLLTIIDYVSSRAYLLNLSFIFNYTKQLAFEITILHRLLEKPRHFAYKITLFYKLSCYIVIYTLVSNALYVDELGSIMQNMNMAVDACNRFGLGAAPHEINVAKANPKQWLIEQLNNISFSDELPSANDSLIANGQFHKNKKSLNAFRREQFSKQYKQQSQTTLAHFYQIYFERQINSEASLNWRLLDFFSNHFSVTARYPMHLNLFPCLEREAIAPNLTGRFSDMLMSVCQHPAMLMYLNNANSFGNRSLLAKKNNKGLNENLAREILELHTLGVKGGYTQTDIIALANGISGWSIHNRFKAKGKIAGFQFKHRGHEPNSQVLLGKTYSQKGLDQGIRMLTDLANHKNTAKHICLKLARHFTQDQPSPSLVKIMVQTWLQTKGNLKAVMVTMINSSLAWQQSNRKYKTPREFIVSSARMLGLKTLPKNMIQTFLNDAGHSPHKAGSPAGYGDMQNNWDGSAALMLRISWTNNISKLLDINIEQAINNAFANTLSPHTMATIARQSDERLKTSLLLMSPDFQYR